MSSKHRLGSNAKFVTRCFLYVLRDGMGELVVGLYRNVYHHSKFDKCPTTCEAKLPLASNDLVRNYDTHLFGKLHATLQK